MLYCAAYSECAGKKTQLKQSNLEVVEPPMLLSKPISKTIYCISHAPPPKATEKYGSREIQALLHGVCVKLEKVKEDRVIMQQLARTEHLIKGNTNFTQLKLLQWYDFSGCPQKYVVYR